MFDVTRRVLLLSLPALAWCDLPSPALAQPETLSFSTSERAFDVLAFRVPGADASPAVLVMGGARGYGSPNYALLAAALNRVGVDAFLIGYLTEGDDIAMRNAGSAHGRIVHYSERMADWADTIPVTMKRLRQRPHPPTRFGVLGVSLGVMPAMTASVNSGDVSALAIVDGRVPDDALVGVRSLPPLLEVWGETDGVFPVGTGVKLEAFARHLGGLSQLVRYPGQGHAFFVEADNADAARARAAIVRFFAGRL